MTEATTETPTRTVKYRVFRFNDDRTDDSWNEKPPLVREDVQWFHPGAEDIGSAYGVGTFMFFEESVNAEGETTLGYVRIMKIGAAARYFEDNS